MARTDTVPELEAPTDEGRPDASAAGIDELIDALRDVAAGHGRADLVARLDEAAWRVARTEMLICVVGEFKKGKSALINALLGQDVCPVDDDLSTAAVTVVRHQDTPGIVVRRRQDGRLSIQTVPSEDAAQWLLEHDQADTRRGVELVEIGLPHPLLARGIALVDTPGVGGLNAAHAVATLAFLPSADALVFVTDASAELTAPEIEFLSRAREAGPPIVLVVTKVDMHPQWRRILELDSGHLADAGIELQTIPVSSMLRGVADRLGDEALATESGIPALHEAIASRATSGARRSAVSFALAEVMPAIEQLREPIETEITALERPEYADELAAEQRAVQTRLAALADADARWSTRLDDEFAALRSQTIFAFQTSLRQLTRTTHDEIERIDPSRSWSELGQRLQAETAAIARTAFLASTDGAVDIQHAIAVMLSDADETFDQATSPIRYDVTEAWRGGPEFGGRTQTGFLATMGLLGGAVVGVEMLGMLGTLAGAAIVGPAAIGVALLFGGKQVVDERRRQLADRRQQARSFVSGFIEDVQFEVDGRLGTLVADLQRQMRDRFAERIRQLQRTNAEAMEALARAMDESSAERVARLDQLRGALAELEELHARATAADVLAEQASADTNVHGGSADDPPGEGRSVPGAWPDSGVASGP
jgi:tRNA U34 5-carboxymethylaminomethyl modifying GTPase MnmE/TrmE